MMAISGNIDQLNVIGNITRAEIKGSISHSGFLIINITDFGASPGETPENNFSAIQSALSSEYLGIAFGNTGETYLISQPIYIPSNKKIIINCTLKIKDGSTALVTSNVNAGSNNFNVDHPEYFKVGEWIGITDDVQFEGYGTLRGSTGQITDITGNTITFDSVCSYNYLTSENAKVGHTQSVIILEDVNNVLITGNGIINGNRYLQEQIHPVRNIAVIEDQRAGCGIVVYKCENITLESVTIRDSLLHNISINVNNGTENYDNTNIKIKGIKTYNGHDKNILIRNIDGCSIEDIITDGATWEDGLIFYAYCKNITVDGAVLTNNGRAGLYWNSQSCDGLEANNVSTSGNLYGLEITAKNVEINTINCEDIILLSNIYNNSQLITINNLTLSGVVGTNVLRLAGNVRDVIFNELIITGCNGTGIKCDSLLGNPAEPPERIVIEGGGIYDHTGNKANIEEGTDITFIDFDNYP